MVIKTSKGMYRILRNFRDAFDKEMFENKYLEEYFDKYPYIVGDYSSGILRLKGFDDNKASNNYYQNIDKYLDDSCAFGAPFYVLTRIHSEAEYNELYEKTKNEKNSDENRCKITPIEKENYDKDSLVLKECRKSKPNINIDSQKINQMPSGSLPEDLKEIAAMENNNNNRNNNSNNSYNKQDKNTKAEPQVESTTYVSSSPDFDPSKKEKIKRNKHKNRR